MKGVTARTHKRDDTQALTGFNGTMIHLIYAKVKHGKQKEKKRQIEGQIAKINNAQRQQRKTANQGKPQENVA